ncbi:hypothetical protein GDO78_012794 [Eleutherodactylus coqui]|uniref:Uncharacterized protein n=1 Tax=Eleutherodactylus coqui TaxID=57060 RepID=A0A8J6K4D7_ELECQ|nr:hypothetical protein GDO78_012794 [Eleutherodactylus coqui]
MAGHKYTVEANNGPQVYGRRNVSDTSFRTYNQKVELLHTVVHTGPKIPQFSAYKLLDLATLDPLKL